MNTFITGSPGCGKSTMIKRLLENLPEKKFSGIITPEIRRAGIRTGFKIVDIVSGREEIMASVNIDRGPCVSRYGVNVKGIDAVLDEFLKSYCDSDCIVIDEIGAMELYSSKFRAVLETVLKSDKTVLASLSIRYVEDYKHWGEIHHVSHDRFEEVYTVLLHRLKPAPD